MSEVNEMDCAEFADAAAELALGVLTGRERARALAHLDRCEACRENVRQLTVTGEELVGMLPAIEPPAGFETRVMARLGLGTPAPGPARRLSLARSFGRKLADWIGGGWTGRGEVSHPRRILAAAATAAAVIVAGLGGWGLHAATSSPTASPLSSAALLTASHQTAGQVYFYDAGSRWLYMSVDLRSGSGAADNGTVICQVEGPGGRLTTVGSFRLTGGYGYWGSPNPVTNGPLTGARLVTTTGTVLATATFPA
ncbi:MAG TPA: zf-HC2 domain-containing protein [Streptosporangiaceae bacterium]